MNRRAPDQFRVRLETTKGPMLLEIQRAWSPRGVDRFFNLVRHGYYDDAAVFRIRAGFWAQFGIAADPAVASAWRPRNIPDDPRVLSNARGTVAFAFKDPNARTTQVFINLRDNAATHDAPADGVPFVPFARVIEGMDVADALYAEYGGEGGRRHSRRQAGSALQGRERVLPARVSEAGLHHARDDRRVAASWRRLL